MRLSLIHEIDVRDAARRVVTLSRDQLNRVVGHAEAGEVGKDNPYIQVFVELYRYARGESEDDSRSATQLEVAGSVLDNPMYAGAEGQIESPLLRVVLEGVRARRKLRSGKPLTAEEAELLK